jgi:hypothetical protein
VSPAVQFVIDVRTVICQGPSVSRESVAAAKLQQPADASLTIWRRPFHPDVVDWSGCHPSEIEDRQMATAFVMFKR